MPSPNKITPAQLFKRLGTADCPTLIDVCIDDDFNEDPFLVPGAIRWPHTDIDGLVAFAANRPIVAICQKGKKLSEGVAALLRCNGIAAQVLEGGNIGWREAGLPRVPAAKIPERQADQGTLWVTRQRPKIDRIACPWLIRRFVDPRARFLFVSPSEVTAVAERFGATAFDVEGVFWSHRDDKCTFDIMLDEFDLEMPALRLMAGILRGADTGNPDLTPQSHGVQAILLGLSRSFRDDLEQLEAGMKICDYLFLWARDAKNETHNWPVSRA